MKNLVLIIMLLFIIVFAFGLSGCPGGNTTNNTYSGMAGSTINGNPTVTPINGNNNNPTINSPPTTTTTN